MAENSTNFTQYSNYLMPTRNSIISLSSHSLDKGCTMSIEKDKIKFTQLIDPKGFDANAALQFGVEELPSKYLFNPEGILIANNPSEEEIIKLIKS